jgi:hypothetical protein
MGALNVCLALTNCFISLCYLGGNVNNMKRGTYIIYSGNLPKLVLTDIKPPVCFCEDISAFTKYLLEHVSPHSTAAVTARTCV